MDQHLAAFGDRLLVRVHGAAIQLKCMLILTLRDTSYRANNDAVVQTSYNAKYFTVIPAETSTILGKRLHEINETKIDLALDKFVHLLRIRFAEDTTAIQSTIVELIHDWADPLANHDRRKLLEILRTIIASPHITSDSFMRVHFNENDFGLARGTKLHIKVKMAMMLGRYRLYHDDAQEHVFVLNLFDNGKVTEAWHSVIRLLLLRYLESKRDSGETLGELIERVILACGRQWREMINHNIGKIIQVGLAALIDEGNSYENTLVSQPVADHINKYLHRRIHITYNGLFHLERLLYDGTYLDEMRFVSPVAPSFIERIRAPFRAGKISSPDERYESTRTFIRYLRTAEQDPGSCRIADVLNVSVGANDILSRYNQLEIQHQHVV